MTAYITIPLEFFAPVFLKIANLEISTNASFLIIGNFFPDSLTASKIASPNSLKYAYYYIDDILVKKEPPFLDIPDENKIITWEPIEEGKVIRLKNIFFDIDEAELLPHSHIEMQKLLFLLQFYPNMIIEISGHTDIDGNDEYNLQLSTRRARAVVEYLISELSNAISSTIAACNCLESYCGAVHPSK